MLRETSDVNESGKWLSQCPLESSTSLSCKSSSLYTVIHHVGHYFCLNFGISQTSLS
uniref:Uncharacterized protein n=1 Tax=Rhizophora mucronata TaxID=61149 RepID=A0A2P2NH60_RHIMU